MKRIILITLCLFLLIFLSTPFFAIEDYTAPGSTSPTQQPGAYTIYDPISVQNNAGISRIEAKLNVIQQSVDSCFKTSDIDALKLELYSELEAQTSVIFGKMLSILLVFSAFFFSILFVFKGKGWL